MGGGLSAHQLRGDQEEIITLMMPVYFIKDVVVTQQDIDLVKVGWNKIVKDQTEPYLKMKETMENPPASCISWFYTVYYNRLFDVHPLCKPLFTSGLVAQGTFLVRMISIILKQLGDPANFQKVIEGLALRHCQRGVKAVEYGIVGEVLFYAMSTCQGPTDFTQEVDVAWRRIYSGMIKIIIPLCIKYELGGANQIIREVTTEKYAGITQSTLDDLTIH